MKREITKEEFLARCSNAYDAGLIDMNRLTLMAQWLDVMMRLEHSWLSNGQTQMRYVLDFMDMERTRLGGRSLANDTEGYSLIQLGAILGHHCQKCATDKDAWWTRSAFCRHKDEEKKDGDNPVK